MGSAELSLLISLLLMAAAVYNFVAVIMENSEENAMDWASENAPQKSDNGFLEFSRPMAHFFSMGLAKKIKSIPLRRRIQYQLKTAGLSRVLNIDEYIAIQIFWAFFFPLIAFILNFALQMGFSPFLILSFAGIGAYFPAYHCKQKKQERYTSVIVDLPFFIDLLALATEAGMDFITSIQRIVEKSRTESVLAEEFDNVLRDIKLGRSRAESLKALADRLDINEVSSFVAVLIDADATGVGIGPVLKQQSIQMRLERLTRAEKAGAKASQTIMLPLILFLMPAVMIVVLGPAILQFITGGK